MNKVLMASILLSAGFLLSPGVANAGPACEHRSTAHAAEHGGMRFDSDWHVAHGELPTCDADRRSSDEHHEDRDDTLGREPADAPGSSDDDPKSRYCRSHWYC